MPPRRRFGIGFALAAGSLAASGLSCSELYDSDDFTNANRLHGCWYRLTDQVDDPATGPNEAEAFGEAWFILEQDHGSLSGCFARLFFAAGATDCPFEELLGTVDEEDETRATVRILAQNAVVTMDLRLQLNEEDTDIGDPDVRDERVDDTLVAIVRDEFLRDAPFFAKGPFSFWRAPGVGEALCPDTCGDLVVLIDERPAAGDPPGPICGELAGITVQP